jgi:ABC-type Fe3+ transport system permease subunit
MEEASLTMRASRWVTLRKVTLPLIRPGIANAFLLGMISSAADFGNPLVLGGEYDVLSTEIYFSIAGAQLDFARAAALGLLLLFLSLLVYTIQKKWVGQTSYVTVTGIQTAGNITPLPRGLQRAGSLKTIRSVLVPLMRSTIVSSMAYSFIRAMTTVSAVIFLATAGTDVATTYILSRVESGDTGVAVAYGSILIFTMLCFTLLVQVVTGRSRTEKQVKTR